MFVGPSGFGIHRYLTAQGEECVAVNPSSMPKRSGDRIKTDQRDGRALARLHRAGDLTAIYIPTDDDEAVRDLDVSPHLGTDRVDRIQKSGHIVYTRRMPWMETNVSKERLAFVRDLASGHWSMTELCERYGITRPTGYKWAARYDTSGSGGLADRSRAPITCGHATSDALVGRILLARREYGWGAKKLLQVLQTRFPAEAWPARSTVNAILDRHHLLHKNRRRRKWAHPGVAPLVTQRPNEVWPADFKGQFRTGDGRYCFPLTITDHFSRAVLTCYGLRTVMTRDVKPVWRALFRAVGLPDAIRTDNGPPFASTGIHGLTGLNVWWMQLGIVHQRITPASPQENGTHERMHRELKRETTRPAAATLRAQQRRFDAFRQRYNDERPHEALNGDTPSARWYPSARPFPERLAAPAYPAHLEVRRVSTAGTFRLGARRQPFLSHALSGQDVALEEVDDGIWNIVYYRTLLGKIDERTSRITGTKPGK